MIDYTVCQHFATHPFVFAPYQAGVDGVLRPHWPNACIDAEDGVGCSVVFDHWRERKTGPCFPIAVVRCLVHRRGFTVYPPGHVPYGQVAVAPVGPDGRERVEEDRWSGTLFGAGLEAAQGRFWLRETPEVRGAPGPMQWRSTQRRHLGLALALLGLLGAMAVGGRLRPPPRHAGPRAVDPRAH